MWQSQETEQYIFSKFQNAPVGTDCWEEVLTSQPCPSINWPSPYPLTTFTFLWNVLGGHGFTTLLLCHTTQLALLCHLMGSYDKFLHTQRGEINDPQLCEYMYIWLPNTKKLFNSNRPLWGESKMYHSNGLSRPSTKPCKTHSPTKWRRSQGTHSEDSYLMINILSLVCLCPILHKSYSVHQAVFPFYK